MPRLPFPPFSGFRVAALRAALLCAVLLAGGLSAFSALAQGFHDAPGKTQRPAPHGRLEDLDALFAALKAAPDTEAAKAIADRIWARWLISDSDTTNLLMSRVSAAIAADDVDLAMKLLDAVIVIRPDYVEAWNRRATLYYMQKDYERSLADIRQILAREPRHFGALAGLGMILQELGDDRRALNVYRRLLEVHPQMQGIAERVRTLTEKVEGRDI